MLEKQKLTIYDIKCDICNTTISEEMIECLDYKPIYINRKQIYQEFNNSGWKRKKGQHVCSCCLTKKRGNK